MARIGFVERRTGDVASALPDIGLVIGAGHRHCHRLVDCAAQAVADRHGVGFGDLLAGCQRLGGGIVEIVGPIDGAVSCANPFDNRDGQTPKGIGRAGRHRCRVGIIRIYVIETEGTCCRHRVGQRCGLIGIFDNGPGRGAAGRERDTIVGASEFHRQSSHAQRAVPQADGVGDVVLDDLSGGQTVEHGLHGRRRKVIGDLAVDDGHHRAKLRAFRCAAHIRSDEIAPHGFAGCDIAIVIVHRNLTLRSRNDGPKLFGRPAQVVTHHIEKVGRP